MIATEFLATLELKICKINLFSLKFFQKILISMLWWGHKKYTYHCLEIDYHGAQDRTDGKEHAQQPVVEVKQAQTHHELGGGVLDEGDKLWDDAKEADHQQERPYQDNLQDCPKYLHFFVFLKSGEIVSSCILVIVWWTWNYCIKGFLLLFSSIPAHTHAVTYNPKANWLNL